MKLLAILPLSIVLGSLNHHSLAQSAERVSLDLGTKSRSGQAYLEAIGVRGHRFREVMDIGKDRSRLEYSLSSLAPLSKRPKRITLGSLTADKASEQSTEELYGLGLIGFSERWLLAHLNQALPDLERIEIVDIATGRSRGGPPTTSLERSLVLTGPNTSVQTAIKLLDEYVERSQIPVLFECIVFSRPMNPTNSTAAVSVVGLDKASFESELASLQPHTLLNSPSIMTNANMAGTVSLVNQVAYIQDFKLETVPSSAGPESIADPVIGVIQEGFVMGVTALVGPDDKTLHISASFEIAKLRLPIRDYDINIGMGSPVTIQLPELSTVQWSSDELVLDQSDYGFKVSNLYYIDWNEDGESESYALDVLVHASIIDPNPEASEPLGAVIGYDARTNLAFVRRNSSAVIPKGAKTVIFQRDGKQTAEGTVLEIQASMFIIQIKNGEPDAGDTARQP
ncbi:MAG: hypothetical protein ACI8X5_001367 [Planctomycetota bacterium]|jgi:hypothetical protein